MGDRVDLADRGEELIAQTLSLRGAAHETGDVDEGEPGGHDLRRLADCRQRLQPRVGHGHLAGVRLDGAERVIGGLRRRRPGEGVEKRRLADIWQADDAAAKTHDSKFRESRPDIRMDEIIALEQQSRPKTLRQCV